MLNIMNIQVYSNESLPDLELRPYIHRNSENYGISMYTNESVSFDISPTIEMQINFIRERLYKIENDIDYILGVINQLKK